ncbi:MAG: hypothetical protein WA885_24805 [Phormidesmis sp.]
MQSFREPSARSHPTLSIPLPLATDLALGLGTVPLLLLLASSRLVAEGLTQLGQQSEEVFRGDRLPTLPLMDSSPAASIDP